MKSFHFLNGLLACLPPLLTSTPSVPPPACGVPSGAPFAVTARVLGTGVILKLLVLQITKKPPLTPKGPPETWDLLLISVASKKWQASP